MGNMMLYNNKEDFKDQIQTIVNTLQCVTMRQLYHLIPNKLNKSKEELENMVFTTYKYHYISRSQGATPEDNIYYTFDKGNIDHGNIATTWVFIDYVKQFGILPYDALKTACASQKPVTLNVLVEGKLVKFISITNKSDAVQVLLAQEQFYQHYERGEEDLSGSLYMLVLESESLLDELENFKITIPHTVALLSFENNLPMVEYFCQEN